MLQPTLLLDSLLAVILNLRLLGRLIKVAVDGPCHDNDSRGDECCSRKVQQDLGQGEFPGLRLFFVLGLSKVMLIVFHALISVKALLDDGEVVVGEEVRTV